MKLAEALMERKDLVMKINKIKELIKNNVVTRKDFQLPIDMRAQFLQYQKLQGELELLNKKIDKTNALYLTDKLNELRILDSKIAFYKECHATLISNETSWRYGDEVTLQRNYDLNELASWLEQTEVMRRKIDREVQKINWETELIT